MKLAATGAIFCHHESGDGAEVVPTDDEETVTDVVGKKDAELGRR